MPQRETLAEIVRTSTSFREIEERYNLNPDPKAFKKGQVIEYLRKSDDKAIKVKVIKDCGISYLVGYKHRLKGYVEFNASKTRCKKIETKEIALEFDFGDK